MDTIDDDLSMIEERRIFFKFDSPDCLFVCFVIIVFSFVVVGSRVWLRLPFLLETK